MDIIKTEATRLIDKIEDRASQLDLNTIKSSVTGGLYTFHKSSDRKIFLETIIATLTQDLQEHICTNPGNCAYENGRKKIIFVAQQEFDELISETRPEDEFTTIESYEIRSRIDEIITTLRGHSAAHEVLFDELQDLKERINHGKKGFSQLALGKVMGIVATGVIDRSLAQAIYDKLSDGATNVQHLLDTIG